MNKALRYAELSDELQEQLTRLAKPGLDYVPATSLFLVDERGLWAFRLAQMFDNGVPVKWGEALDFQTGKPMQVAKKGELPPIVRASDLLAQQEGDKADFRGDLKKILEEKFQPSAGKEEAPSVGDVRMVDVAVIDRCPLNPRKTFTRERLDELKASFRAHGFLQGMSHLWVRPHPVHPGRFELVDGERRHIVLQELRTAGMEISEVPCVVSELSDAQVLEYALVNALQREELSPLEEAKAICQLLEMPNPDGTMPTAAELAGHLSCQPMHISRCKLLAKLIGTPAGEAIEEKRLSEKHGEMLARVGNAKKRDELTRRILNPSDKRGALPVDTLAVWIRDEVQVALRTASFDVVDAELVPVKIVGGERVCGGECAVPRGEGDRKNGAVEWICPFVEASAGRAMCTNPECFKAKEAVQHQTWRERMQAKGCVTIEPSEAEKMWDQSRKRLLPILASEWVEIEDSPEETEITTAALAEMAGKVPRWKKLVQGQKVEILAVKDPTGAEHLLVKRAAAKAAAVQNGHDIFRKSIASTPAAPAPGSGDGQSEIGDRAEDGDPRIQQAAEDVKKQAEQQAEFAKRQKESRIEDRYDRTVDREIVERTRGLKKLDFEFWKLILAPMAETVKEQQMLVTVCLALGLSENRIAQGMSDEDLAAWLDDTMRDTPEVHLPSVAMILARGMLYESEVEQWLKVVCKGFGVDLRAARKRAVLEVEAELAAEAEQKEIEEGIQWQNQPHREKALDFEWDGNGDCISPNGAQVTLPKGVKWELWINTARASKGWAFGIVIYHKKALSGLLKANRNAAVYDNEALAIKSALLALQKAMEDAQAPEAALKRIAAYIENVRLPDERPAAKKKGKK